MPVAIWNSTYETGDQTVDEQHQQLFAMVNELHDGITTGKGREVLMEVLDKLADYVAVHFRTEEKLMAEKGYPDIDNHKKIHENLTNKTLAMIEDYQNGSLVLSITLSQFLAEWLNVHINQEDKKMIKFCQGSV